jgi:putative intracellular protease/amidase/ketosteroid isomerase-like protein
MKALYRIALILGIALLTLAFPEKVRPSSNEKSGPVSVLVLLGEWFGDAYFPLKDEIAARGWTMKRIGVDVEYRGCYNKKRDVVLRSDILIPDLKDFAGYDALIIPSGPQFRKFRENPAVLRFVREAHAAGLLVAAFCTGNFLVKAAGLVDLPDDGGLFPAKVTLVKEGILIGPRGGGPPPGDGFESAPVKEICDAIVRELEKKAGPPARSGAAGGDELGRIEQSIRDCIGWAKTKDFRLLYGVIANDPDFLEVHPDGAVVKGIEDFRKAEKFWGSPDFKAVRYEIRDLKIKLSRSGDVAWFYCILDDINEWKGQPANWENTRWTGVLEKRDGRWVMAQQHFSFAAKD